MNNYIIYAIFVYNFTFQLYIPLHPFNHVCCSGVYIARSVDLMHFHDWNLHRKGGARTHPKGYHPIPQVSPLSMKFLLTTGSPQTTVHVHLRLAH